LQLGRRRRGRQPRAQQAADADRRGRPHRQQQGGRPARSRPASRRRPPARRARQHLALQPVDRPAASDHRRAAQQAAQHRRRSRRAGARTLRRAVREPFRRTARENLPADHAVSPRPRVGRPSRLPGRHPGKHPPASAGAAEPARRIPPDGRRRVRVTGRRRDRSGPADLRDLTVDRGRAGCGSVQVGPPDVDVDLHGPRQPAIRRLAFRAEPARHLQIRSPHMNRPPAHDRLLTVPNVLSGLRLALIPVFVYLLLVAHADGWAVAILMFSGASDWADGKIARLMNQSSRLGEYLDPFVDRLYMVTTPIAFGLRHIVPWWIIAILLIRDVLLAAELPLLRTRGITALPVVYVGKAATFALMSAFPLILLGQWDAQWSRVVLACGWAFLIWGTYMYLWSFFVYAWQVVTVLHRMPPVKARDG